jgi:hypothetical protein
LISRRHDRVFDRHKYLYTITAGYYANQPDTLCVLDVADPAQPEVRSRLALAHACFVRVNGPIAYTSYLWNSYVNVVDVFDPAHPVALGTWD